jgi:hypothetical protein
MTFSRERLLELLPAIYRLRDEEGDGTLAAVLGVLAQQAEVLGEDLEQLYDDQFIETCAEWVVPYIAELVGARGVVSIESAAFSARAYVANTIRYRRRKGTIAVVEQLARDVTGWPASAVEYFLRLITTQNVNHVRTVDALRVTDAAEVAEDLRRWPHATVNLRDIQVIERLDSAFELSAHTADIRRIASRRGRYNIPNVGIFLWRLNAYPLTASPAVQVDSRHFVIHPLGIDSHLVTRPATEADIEQLAEPLNVPMPISRRALEAALASYYGSVDTDRSVLIHVGANAVDIAQVHVCDLSDGSGGWKGAPAEPVAIDPVLGRIAFKDVPAGPVATTFHYAFPADIGGGEYEREASFALGDDNVVRVPQDFATIAAALAAVTARPEAIVEITDSGRYEETLAFTLGAHQRLELRASNGQRPALILGADCEIRGGAQSRLYLNGLLIAGGTLTVPAENANAIQELTLAHCTLVPGIRLARDGSPLRPDVPSVSAGEPNDPLSIVLERSVSGALHVSSLATSINAKDSIIDGGPARDAMAVVSGKHNAPIDLLETNPAIDVTIGARGPTKVSIPKNTYSVAAMRNELQSAIRGADAAFSGATVLADGGLGTLIVLSGTTEAIALAPSGADTATLAAMKLDVANARIVRPLISDALPDPVKLSASPNAAVTVRIGATTYGDVALAEGTLVQVRNQLATALAADAFVVSAERRLLIVPKLASADVEVKAATLDRTTFRQLGFNTAREAIRGFTPGTDAPPLSLDRSTILGPVRTVALPYVSDSIFSGPVLARRKQTGCVRFSFVADGSQTPRRYRCQPDLEVAEEVARRARQLQQKGFPSKADLAQIRAAIVLWMVPGFVTTRYGDAAYVQLTRSTARQIRTGSENGSEMGAYAMLEQPQREANLRAALDEYLRFGLEAGIFYAS